MFFPLSSRSASVLHLFHQLHPQTITRQLIHGQDALWAAHNGAYLMNATPGRDLCWLLTRHPEKPEYHVVLCVRQEYFDGPELDRLILDAWSNVLGFASPGEAKQYQKQITRDVVLDSRSPDCENILKELIWAFSDFARDRRGVCDPEARCLAGNPGYPGSAGPF
ncbi:hypothetical protein HC623_21715 [Escherichia coli]|nr:hypothetical protein [Escherichia coli]